MGAANSIYFLSTRKKSNVVMLTENDSNIKNSHGIEFLIDTMYTLVPSSQATWIWPCQAFFFVYGCSKVFH